MIGAAAVVVVITAPWVPRDQVIVVRLDAAEPVKRLKVSYTPDGESDPISGATLAATGSSAGSVRHAVSLPNGRYLVSIDAELALSDGGVRETSHVRRVTLEGGETLLRLADTP